MKIRYDRFPDGKMKAVTMSYDDGRDHDRRLVEIMNRYGLKGAFHLNSGKLGNNRYITAEEVATLFAGHEVSAHTVTHPHLELTPPERVAMELLEDRQALEELVGYPVKGMSYPFGSWNEQVVHTLPALGIEYARTTRSHGGFQLPENWLEWHPTCHHKSMLEHGEKFLAYQAKYSRMVLLYVWGHSYEFENDANWELMEQFGELVGRQPQIWYATNAEIVAYMKALQQLRWSVSGSIVHNPSALSVWVGVEDEAVEIAAGATLQV
ncbi:polysaccharide deacetylase family protein [Paenibacillus agricola]|uniref:Polysaccharide deacetylase family protein n=1 Tax=Paenibacillus agricola TaxID=2716264 RepID=A0ABX0J6K9_9BACL|nr:polysaccharide deacetylase family protein [Paenibacillus agricola]NHN31416.1 polysaccharide deacetylase family protein [Paenibacillus agricola]